MARNKPRGIADGPHLRVDQIEGAPNSDSHEADPRIVAQTTANSRLCGPREPQSLPPSPVSKCLRQGKRSCAQYNQVSRLMRIPPRGSSTAGNGIRASSNPGADLGKYGPQLAARERAPIAFMGNTNRARLLFKPNYSEPATRNQEQPNASILFTEVGKHQPWLAYGFAAACAIGKAPIGPQS